MDSQSLTGLISHVMALPQEDRLTFLRAVAPRILAGLDDEDRDDFVRDLNFEIARALRDARDDQRPGHGH